MRTSLFIDFIPYAPPNFKRRRI